VTEAVQKLLTKSVHNTLNDSRVLEHSMEFPTDLVGDDIIQRTLGEALRNTFTYAVQPGLVLWGVVTAIVVFSFYANKNLSTFPPLRIPRSDNDTSVSNNNILWLKISNLIIPTVKEIIKIGNGHSIPTVPPTAIPTIHPTAIPTLPPTAIPTVPKRSRVSSLCLCSGCSRGSRKR